jgi:hypothetical protein
MKIKYEFHNGAEIKIHTESEIEVQKVGSETFVGNERERRTYEAIKQNLESDLFYSFEEAKEFIKDEEQRTI